MKLLQTIIITLFFLIYPLIAIGADDCKADPNMVKLIKDLVAHPNLASAIKKDVDLTEIWYDLEKSNEADLNNNENVLDLLIEVPAINNNFQTWFDKLTPEQTDTLWTNKELRERIEDRLRKPKGFHEWCMVCRAPTFKRWGVTAKEIQTFRTETLLLKWTAPEDSGAEHPGEAGGHGGNGSGAFHNELKAIIDTSNSYNEFQQRVKELISRWKIDTGLLKIP